jgi:antitoxin ParD1/3/4
MPKTRGNPAYASEMGTMNISLPEGMKAFIDQQVAERGYGSSSEYVCDLIRREQGRMQLRSLILEGAAAPVRGEADAAWFGRLRARARHPADKEGK